MFGEHWFDGHECKGRKILSVNPGNDLHIHLEFFNKSPFDCNHAARDEKTFFYSGNDP
jgi:hypothetical protein